MRDVMKKILSLKNGMSHIQTVVLVLIIAMIFSVIFSYWSMMTVVNTSKDTTKRVLDSYVMHNSIEIYNSLKNGNDYSEELDKIFYKSSLLSEFSLDLRGNTIYSYGEDGKLIYYMTNPTVDYDYSNTLKLNASYRLYMPIRFGGIVVTYLWIPITVRSYYNLKY